MCFEKFSVEVIQSTKAVFQEWKPNRTYSAVPESLYRSYVFQNVEDDESLVTSCHLLYGVHQYEGFIIPLFGA